MAGQAKIQQHRVAPRLDQHIGRLEVEVTDLLLVQTVHRPRHGHANPGQLVRWQRLVRFVKQLLQRAARHIFHHQIGQLLQVTGRHQARHMRARQYREDLPLHFKTDDVFSAIALSHARHFHDHGKRRAPRRIGKTCLINVRHAASMQAVPHQKAIHERAGCEQLHNPCSSLRAKNSGRPAARISCAAARWSYATR